MRMLLVAATEFELRPFMQETKSAEVFISGVGIPVTMYALATKLLMDRYDLVIQAGIAGTFSKQFEKGQVVLVKQDAFGDVGAEAKGHFKTIYQMGLAAENQFPFTGGWLVNHHKIFQETALKAVKAVTVNRLSDRKKQKLQLQKSFEADIESMEGAAFHYVCMQMSIPFLQIRSISNFVGERDKNKWSLPKAIHNLNIELSDFIQTLSK